MKDYQAFKEVGKHDPYKKNKPSVKTDLELTQIVKLEDYNIKSYCKCILYIQKVKQKHGRYKKDPSQICRDEYF